MIYYIYYYKHTIKTHPQTSTSVASEIKENGALFQKFLDTQTMQNISFLIALILWHKKVIEFFIFIFSQCKRKRKRGTRVTFTRTSQIESFWDLQVNLFASCYL